MKVFRSLTKETRITGTGAEFEMYIEPTQSIWFKYRRKSRRKTSPDHGRTVRVGIPQVSHMVDPPPDRSPECSAFLSTCCAKELGLANIQPRRGVLVTGGYSAANTSSRFGHCAKRCSYRSTCPDLPTCQELRRGWVNTGRYSGAVV